MPNLGRDSSNNGASDDEGGRVLSRKASILIAGSIVNMFARNASVFASSALPPSPGSGGEFEFSEVTLPTSFARLISRDSKYVT
jgi:hypothetical protein